MEGPNHRTRIQDDVTRFLSEKGLRTGDRRRAWTSSKELRELLQEWVEEHGLDRHWASSMWKALQDTLRSRDAYPRKFKGARGWRGVERLGDDEGLAEEVPLSQGGFRSLVS